MAPANSWRVAPGPAGAHAHAASSNPHVDAGTSPKTLTAGSYPKSSKRMFSGSTPSESSMSMHALSIIGGPHR